MKPVSIIFGLKSIIRRKQKNFFAIIAITLGVSLITGIPITTSSLSKGFGFMFSYSLGETDGKIIYSNTFMNESIADEIGANVVTLPNVTYFTKELSLPITTSTSEGQMNIQSSLKGINPTDNPNIFGKLINLENKELNVSTLNDNEVFMGKALAKDLHLNIDDSFYYSIVFGNIRIEKTVIVKDIVKNEQRGAMGSNEAIFMPLSKIQSVLKNYLLASWIDAPNAITVIYLKFSSQVISVDDGNLLINQIKDKLANDQAVAQLGGVKTLEVSTDRISILDTSKYLADALGNILTIFGSILILAGLILIVNIQLMSIENNEKQIGIQRAVGTQTYQIILSNLTEFVIIGLIGGFLGIFGGAAFGWLLIQAFGYAFGFSGSYISLIIPPSIYITAFFIGFLISILAGLYPSIKASRIDVIEVLRGIQNTEFKINKGSGVWGFVFGLFLTILGLLSVMGLSKNPFDYPASYANINDAESIYISTTLLLVGILVLLSYFISRSKILTITGLSLIIYPLIQIFIVFNEIKTGSGGVNYLVIMMISLVGGSVLLIALNLDIIANISERIFSVYLSAVSLISFKQMASQKTRSTLTFAIFAFILTLNIMLASWSYSDRYGAENQVNKMSGGSDILITSSLSLSQSIASAYMKGLETNFSSITYAATFPSSGGTDVYFTNSTEGSDPNAIYKTRLNLFSINNESLYNEGKLQFNFVLNPVKLNTTSFSFPAPFSSGLETDNKIAPIERFSDSNAQEDANTWQFFSDGMMVTNRSSGKTLPVIITSPLITYSVGPTAGSNLKNIGDSVWLPLKNGTLQEFVILTTSSNNPLFDSYLLGGGFPGLSTCAFVQEYWANLIEAFHPSPLINLLDQVNYFLISSKNNVKSNANENLASDIESWSNGIQNGTFRSQQGILYGFLSTTIYSLYSILFDAQFKVFVFMQYFTTLGFLFGVVSLLVVSVRTVQERKREIGMMRSIGVKRGEVIISLILELSVMGVIGLAIGLLIGNVLAYALVHINSAGLEQFLIPWETILIYVTLTIGSAFIASIIPGRVASKIPPSEALRYVG